MTTPQPTPFLFTYPPSTSPDTALHTNTHTQVGNYATSKDIMHTLFYGPECSGKLHMAQRFITQHTGVDVQRVKRIAHEFKTKDKSFPFFKSSVHFEINVNDFGQSNQKCLMDLVQELSRTLNVSRNTYKIILLCHAEQLTQSIQHQLRRMMELFYATTRLIMLSSSLDRIDVTIQSRLVCIRMPMIGHKPMSLSTTKSTPSSGPPKMNDWLKQMLGEMECIDVTTECTQQLWRVLSKKTKLVVKTLRKWVRVIQFTQLPHTGIVLTLYSKVCAKFSNDVTLHKDLLSLLNYYLYMQDVGYRKDYQLEMILFVTYMCMHHRDVFDALVQQSRNETH